MGKRTRKKTRLKNNERVESKKSYGGTASRSTNYKDFFKGTNPERVMPCYTNHPALQIGDYLVYGGNCHTPVVTDADLYVALDHLCRYKENNYPWDSNYAEELYFRIQDFGVPHNTNEFRKLITYLSEKVREGCKVHVGCIGGHGRTGMVLTALYYELTGDKDALNKVRKGYCSKAVETRKQEVFLQDLYGLAIPPVDTPAKEVGFSNGKSCAIWICPDTGEVVDL